ncbi:hypothetical protein E2C01_055347 [Portunus trituberculatus]|uniref:Uncharacterized protein n=1 Tax=Portunus trituberculatus TaxID=210409 RepID=A0A5B7GWJ8_PORTR|nr:hypothetical protein [Portunus trituberculatus]
MVHCRYGVSLSMAHFRYLVRLVVLPLQAQLRIGHKLTCLPSLSPVQLMGINSKPFPSTNNKSDATMNVFKSHHVVVVNLFRTARFDDILCCSDVQMIQSVVAIARNGQTQNLTTS